MVLQGFDKSDVKKMRQVNSFKSLHAAFEHRVVRLAVLAGEAERFDLPLKRRAASYLAIEIHNCWAGFARASYLSSMCGVKTLGGKWAQPRLGCSPTSDDALNKAIALLSHRGGRHSEPHWFDKTIVTRLANNFDLTNTTSIASGFAYQTSIFSMLPTFRNYFAHKCEETAAKVEKLRKQKIPSYRGCPSQLLIDPQSGAAPSLMVEWVHDVRTMGQLLLN